VHFPDAEPLVLGCDPPLGQAEVLARYPSALAAEPQPTPLQEELPPEVAKMFAKCVKVGLYDEGERAVLRAMHTADAEGASVLVTEMYERIGRCWRCSHAARPGLSDAPYCSARDDLPIAYGLLHWPPVDLGATCDRFCE
jgi:hypothetical protein